MGKGKKNVSNENQNGRKKKETMFRITMRRLIKNKMAVLGMIVLAIAVLIAIFGPLIAPYDYAEPDIVNAYAGPSLAHPFGTDDLGRDIFSRMIIGTRASLSIGLISVAFAAVVGITLGAVSGYFGGLTDQIIMRAMDILQALPSLILAIAVCAALGAGLNNCILAISISTIPGFVRMARATVLNIREMEYLEAATAINCSTVRIIIRHILPNAMAPLIVQMTMGVATNILAASSLSFIGLGVQPPDPEWGAMLSAGRNYIRNYPHMVLFPGIVIMLVVLALNMLGDGLRDALDPKLKD